MLPVNSMIEFKQIIGRGTRLYDGKDYFTIYDFVKAHHHFSDPEWDGEPIEPIEPEPCPKMQLSPVRLCEGTAPAMSRMWRTPLCLYQRPATTILQMLPDSLYL
jgi:type I restriction enzyme R subunit